MCICLLQGCLWIGLFGYLFYKSIFGVLVLLPLLIFYVKDKRRQKIKEQKQKLKDEFKDGIIVLANCLRTGHAIENALLTASKDLGVLHGVNSMIVKEFQDMARQLQMNMTIEQVLEDFANRSHIEDIQSFVAVFVFAKRSGGNLIRIIHATVGTISEKMEIIKEVETMMAAKKMEQSIMNLIPLGMIVYVDVTSPGFMDPMYHNTAGIIIMSICLGIYGVALKIAKKIIAQGERV